jgi:hypothetical protein
MKIATLRDRAARRSILSACLDRDHEQARHVSRIFSGEPAASGQQTRGCREDVRQRGLQRYADNRPQDGKERQQRRMRAERRRRNQGSHGISSRVPGHRDDLTRAVT